ncbi:hypothetical protein HDV01_001721 [Terramyces sp. JEL0728]|nr:hypothetical protein HDV01_001721 [Terramyces sp. JEL0728]
MPRFEYALVMLQALLYLQNEQIEGAPKATKQFDPFISQIQKSNIHRMQNDIQIHAAKLYSDYLYMLPNRKYLLPMDSSEQDLILLQEAIDNDLKAQMILAMKLKSMGNEEAAEFWLSSSSKQGYIPNEAEELRALELFNEKYKNKKYEAEIPVIEVPQAVEYTEPQEISNMAVVNASTFDISNLSEQLDQETSVSEELESEKQDILLEIEILSEKQETLKEERETVVSETEIVDVAEPALIVDQLPNAVPEPELQQVSVVTERVDSLIPKPNTAEIQKPKEYLVTEGPKVSQDMTDEDLFSPGTQVRGGVINYVYTSLTFAISTGLSYIYPPTKK